MDKLREQVTGMVRSLVLPNNAHGDKDDEKRIASFTDAILALWQARDAALVGALEWAREYIDDHNFGTPLYAQVISVIDAALAPVKEGNV